MDGMEGVTRMANEWKAGMKINENVLLYGIALMRSIFYVVGGFVCVFAFV